MDTSLGIRETREVLEFGLSLQYAIHRSQEDGKWTLGDAPKFLPVVGKAIKAFKGIKNVKAELLDLQAAEMEELKSMVHQITGRDFEECSEIMEGTIDFVLTLLALTERSFSK